MKSRLVLVAVSLAVVLSGCAGVPSGAVPTPTASATASDTPTPTPAAAPAIVLHVSGVTVEDGSGAVIASAAREDEAGMVQLITDALGSPTSVDLANPFGKRYEWGDDVFVGANGWAYVRFFVPSSGGYELRTDDGITVGSSRDEVVALSPYDGDYDADGDGKSDSLGLEPQQEPGTDSLVHPGDVGTSYIDVLLQGDIVWSLSAPAGDWMDV